MAKFKKFVSLATAALMVATIGATLVACNEEKACTHCNGEHVWNEGVETTPATVSAEGVKTYTCYVCEETKTESIAKIAVKTATLQDATAENSYSNKYVISEYGKYAASVVYDADNGASMVYYTYTATTDGYVTFSTPDEKTTLTVTNEDYSIYEYAVSNTTIAVKSNDVLSVNVTANVTENYTAIFEIAYSATAEADGSKNLPYTLTEAGSYLTTDYVGEDIYYNYTVTGADTVGVMLSTDCAWGAVGVGYNGGKSVYVSAVAGDVITFSIACSEYSIKAATIWYALEELSTTPELGTENLPYIVESAGETFSNGCEWTNLYGPYYGCSFQYTATANGTLTISDATGATINQVMDSDYNWGTFEGMNITVEAGKVYIIQLGIQGTASTFYPTFTFTAAQA